MKFKAVIFDLDGTLLDTLQDLADSTNRSLNHLDLPQHELEAYKYFVGDGREILAMRSLPEHHRNTANVGKLVDLINREYSKCWADHTCPYPGITILLDDLTTRKIKIAVLSNKSHESTEMMVSKMLSRWHFDAVVGASSSIPLKPDPTAAIEIARQLRILPSKCLYVGDTDVDMKTATNAGMYPIGALWGFRTRDELIASGAKALIEHPCDLLRLL